MLERATLTAVDPFDRGRPAELSAGRGVSLRGAHGGAPVPYGSGAPKELLHHLPALVLRRP